MNIHRTPKEDEGKYNLLGQEISKVKDEKDIGVVIDEELSFDKHICEKVNKANSIFAVLRRTFRNLNADIFLPLYKTLVRTHLDYASSVWAPYKKKYIDKIESVQKRATKQIPGGAHLPTNFFYFPMDFCLCGAILNLFRSDSRRNDRVDCLCRPTGSTSFGAQVRSLIT